MLFRPPDVILLPTTHLRGHSVAQAEKEWLISKGTITMSENCSQVCFVSNSNSI